jgi:hypothetical protein
MGVADLICVAVWLEKCCLTRRDRVFARFEAILAEKSYRQCRG